MLSRLPGSCGHGAGNVGSSGDPLHTLLSLGTLAPPTAEPRPVHMWRAHVIPARDVQAPRWTLKAPLEGAVRRVGPQSRPCVQSDRGIDYPHSLTHYTTD